MLPWTHRVHIPNDISIGSSVVAQLTAECPYTLQWVAPFPLKIAPLYIFIHQTGGKNNNTNKHSNLK